MNAPPETEYSYVVQAAAAPIAGIVTGPYVIVTVSPPHMVTALKLMSIRCAAECPRVPVPEPEKLIEVSAFDGTGPAGRRDEAHRTAEQYRRWPRCT